MRTSLRYDFTGADGRSLLAGRLEMPQGKPVCFALFAHCFTCSKDVFAAARVTRYLAEQGVAVLRFDFTGLGGSEGDFANSNFSTNVADLVAAAHALEQDYAAPQLLIGHSLGGAAVLAAAAKLKQIKAVATIGAPADPRHVEKHFAKATPEIMAAGAAVVNLAGREFTITRQFLDDIARIRLEKILRKLKPALMIFHAPEDKIVDFSDAQSLYDAAVRAPKSLITLQGADHMLTDRADSAFVARMLGAWALRLFGAPPETPRRDQPDHGTAHEVMVRETGEGGFANLIRTGSGHVFTADEPTALGGLNSGANPYDLLLASLGACTSMTLRMYATHKQMKIGPIVVKLSHHKASAAELREQGEAGLEEGQTKIDVIERELILPPELTPAQRQKMLEIANKCPVHKSLHATPLVRTKLQDSEA